MAREQTELNYEQDLRIDEMSLDVEWLEHASKFFQYASALAEARKAKDLAKQNLLVARTDLRARLAAAGEKATEGSIEERSAALPEYAEHLRACAVEDKLDAAVRAMNVRKEALENLVKLLGMQYFAGPKEPRDLRKEVNNRAATRAKVSKALNK